MWSVLLCLCLSVSMSVSVWEGGCSWLCEVTGRHGSNFLPFSGPSVGYIEFLFWDHWEMAVLGQILAGRSREVTGGYGRLRREKRRKVEERQEKGRRKPKKMTEMSSVKCRVWSVEWTLQCRV